MAAVHIRKNRKIRTLDFTEQYRVFADLLMGDSNCCQLELRIYFTIDERQFISIFKILYQIVHYTTV